jgi:rRNA-processing protein FCF1
MCRGADFHLPSAISAIEASIHEGSTLRNWAGPVGGHLSGYMNWIRATEQRLAGQFRRADVEHFLLTQRYWEARRFVEVVHLEDLGPGNTVVGQHPATAVVISEATARISDLEEFLAGLTRRRDRYGSLTSPVLVPDTNTFLHYTFFRDAKWSDLTQSADVHLAIPLVVVEELDRQKFSRDPRISDRARGVVRALDCLLASAADGLPQLPGRGSLEVLVEESDHVRLPIPDAEIVETCADLAAFVPTTTSVVTGDLGMKVRARSMGVRVVDLPDEWIWPLPRADAPAAGAHP